MIILLCSLYSIIADDEIIAVPDNGPIPLTVSFQVNTTHSLQSYQWDFQDDSIIDSREAQPAYTYTKEGEYTTTLTTITENNETLTFKKTILAKTAMSLSLTAIPLSGVAPVAVQFTSAATGKEPLIYAWDFNADTITDSTAQNPSYLFEKAGEYQVTLKVTDSTGNWLSKVVSITVTEFDSKLLLDSYFPTSLNQGENEITFIVINNGTENVKGISGKIVGTGIKHLTSSTVPLLKPGEQDSLVIKLNALQSGQIPTTIKILDKNFLLNLSVAETVKYNKEELQQRFQELKQNLSTQEKIYNEKKAAGYLVTEVFDSIKAANAKVEESEKYLLTNKLADAKINLDLLTSDINDLVLKLEQVKKQKQTVLMWIKDNAVAIAAIIAALGTISGFLIKASSKVKTGATKISENVKQKISKKVPEQEHPKEGSEEKKEHLDRQEHPAQEPEKK